MEADTNPKKQSDISEPITNRPDGWLLREWKKGDERAAEVLFERYAIRLVALVASRLNRRYQASIDPSELVQSALGSFFDAAQHSRIQVSESVSLWRLLATFARRKLARALERQSASKRGGDREQVPLEQSMSASVIESVSDDDAEEFVRGLKAELPGELFAVAERVLAGQTQRAIAQSLGIDERTVRRRIQQIRQTLAPISQPAEPTPPSAGHPTNLPRVDYHQFVLGKLLGHGGFGKVYRASMQADGQTVAIKFLRKTFWQNERARESLVREINTASQIQHPGVIRYLGYGESPHGGPYLLSEWIDGRPMQHMKAVDETQFTAWLQQICDAIQAVHQAGLVHGDLTPANILIDQQNRVTITDFGFSQAFQRNNSQLLGGTLGFAAPEQIDPAFGNIGPQTDIYSIGGLIYWYLFQQPPNARRDIAQTLLKTMAVNRQQPPDVSPTTSTLQTIVARALPSSPADRSITIEDILDMIS